MSYSYAQVQETYEKCQGHERVNLVWAEHLRVPMDMRGKPMDLGMKPMDLGWNLSTQGEGSRNAALGQAPATPMQTRQATNQASPRLLQDENVRGWCVADIVDTGYLSFVACAD